MIKKRDIWWRGPLHNKGRNMFLNELKYLDAPHERKG